MGERVAEGLGGGGESGESWIYTKWLNEVWISIEMSSNLRNIRSSPFYSFYNYDFILWI